MAAPLPPATPCGGQARDRRGNHQRPQQPGGETDATEGGENTPVHRRDANEERQSWSILTLIPATRRTTGGRTDALGALFLATALVLLLLPATQGHAWCWTAPSTIACFAGAAVMAAVWALIERRVPEPLVDMRMFVHRPVLVANPPGS